MPRRNTGDSAQPPMMPVVAGGRKRVVLTDRQDVAHIMGIYDPTIHPAVPGFLPNITHNGRLIGATLTKVTTRAIWYREVSMAPPSPAADVPTFHPDQR